MNLHNPYMLSEHIRLHREDLMRDAARSRLASHCQRQPGLQLLGWAGVLLVRVGANLQRIAGQQPVYSVRI